MVHHSIPSYDLIAVHQPYTVIYSGPLFWSSQLQLQSQQGDHYTFIPLTIGIHTITYGTNILQLEVVSELISITLLLLYTKVITGYQYQGVTYTTQGTIASELTFDYTIPIKIKKPTGPLEFYLEDKCITYGSPLPRYGPSSLGTIKIDL